MTFTPPPLAVTEPLRRLNALLETALALPAPEREAWLTQQCDADPPTLLKLRRLLARASAQTDAFLRRSAAETMSAWAPAEAAPDAPGDRVGPWRLLELLGEGGMGRVWLAERASGTPAQKVALKLPRRGLDGGHAERLARERKLLATLAHPRIARLLDAGLGDDNRPWLAMEHVQGLAIDRYSRHERLEPPQILRLALQICDALSHAHVRGIVHRDLKPANVLVTAQGEVRLLDFGIAQLLHGGAMGHAHQHPAGIEPLTPDYASPEQIAGMPAAVSDDIYALGVLLYELLCQQRPYRLERQGAGGVEKAVREAVIPPASSRCANPAHAGRLRAGLDAVLAKALSKNPAQRHPSVEAFALDLQAALDRWRANERPASAA